MVFILAPGHSALRDASTSSRRPRDGLGSGTTADRRLLQSASLPSLPTSPHLQREAVIGSTVARRQASEAAFLSGAPRPHTVHAARKAAAGGHADAAGLEPIFSRESRAFLRQCCPPDTTEASAPSTPPPAPRPATAAASGSRPELPEKYHVLTELPIFTGVDVDPNEWDDIFKWTGHVWQKKEFPTRKGGAKREEARRLLRVLELMDSGGDGEAPTAEAAAGAAVVHEAVLAETVKHVRLKCADHAQLIERVFDAQSAMVKELPARLAQEEAKAGELATELDRARSTAASELARLRPAAAERDALNDELSTARSQLALAEHKVHQADGDAAALRRALEGKAAEAAVMGERQAAAAKALAATNTSLARATRRVESLEVELGGAKEEAAAAATRLKEAEGRNDKLAAESAAAARKVARLESSLRQAEAEQAELQRVKDEQLKLVTAANDEARTEKRRADAAEGGRRRAEEAAEEAARRQRDATAERDAAAADAKSAREAAAGARREAQEAARDRDAAEEVSGRLRKQLKQGEQEAAARQRELREVSAKLHREEDAKQAAAKREAAAREAAATVAAEADEARAALNRSQASSTTCARGGGKGERVDALARSCSRSMRG